MSLCASLMAVGIGISFGIWVLCPTGMRLVRSSLAAFGRRWLHLLHRRPPTKKADVAAELIFTDVSALLRAGISPGICWERAAGVPTDHLGIPDVHALKERVGEASAISMVAASKLAMRLGAPLAPVLLAVGGTLEAERQVEAERRAALGGPQSTARVLLALPVVGLVIGMILGANPFEVATEGGLGSVSIIVGVALLLAGRIWIRSLIQQAEAAS
jgi:tight adherence protein B